MRIINGFSLKATLTDKMSIQVNEISSTTPPLMIRFELYDNESSVIDTVIQYSDVSSSSLPRKPSYNNISSKM